MRVLVTGGAGFIGVHLCAHLLKLGHDVTCLDNLSSASRAPLPKKVRFIQSDVRDPFLFACDAIYHLACPASPVDYARDPWATIATAAIGTANALRCAVSARARIVLASTSEVYGDPLEHPQDEEYWGNCNPVGPRSCYSEGKRCAEAMAVAMASCEPISVGIARICNTYGPGMRPDDGRVIPTFIEQARKGGVLQVTGDGSQTRCFCYVDDTVRGLVALMGAIGESRGRPLIVNLGNPDERTILSVAEDIRQRLGGRVVQTGLRPVDDPERRCPRISKARALLGWEPRVTFSEGLDRTIESWGCS